MRIEKCEALADIGALHGVEEVRPLLLRFDRAELDGTTMVIQPSAAHLRTVSRENRLAPLAYLYECDPGPEPPTRLRLEAGHYDAERCVWVFSGDISAIIGITAPASDATPDVPGIEPPYQEDL